MKTNKLVIGSGAGFRCADHRHGVEAYCSANCSATMATVISGESNLYEPIGINSRGVEYLGIGRVTFNINQWEFIH
jgi:hypothetical protein